MRNGLTLYWKSRSVKRRKLRPEQDVYKRQAYGRYQNVFLTDEEMADLQASFPTVWGQYIEKLSEYMASTCLLYTSRCV